MRRRREIPLTSRVWCDTLSPIDTREIHEWALECIELPHSYAVPGPFRVQASRYLIDPFVALRAHGVRKVTVSKATQTGGSLLFDVAIPWYVTNNPGPILLAMSTDEVAVDHMQSRILPVMRACRALQPLLPSDPRLLTRNGVVFPHMPFWAYGSAPAKLQSKSVLFAIGDEAWLWEPGRLQWLEARVSAFARVGLSKLLLISQPGDAGDDHDRAWRAGTMEDWAVHCTLCGHLHVPEWSGRRDDGTPWGMLWDSTDQTRPGWQWDPTQVAPTIRYECPSCRNSVTDSISLKRAWNETGRYVQGNPSPEPAHRSFRWSAITIDPWEPMVRQFLSAMDSMHAGVFPPLRAFIQQRLARPYDPDALLERQQRKVEVYDVQSDWPEEVVRFMTIDVQHDRYVAEVRSWAADGESRQRWWGDVHTEESLVELQEQHRVASNCVFIDTGFDSRRVYAMILRHGWAGLRGEDKPHYRLRLNDTAVHKVYSSAQWGDPGQGTAAGGRRYAKYFFFASPTVKDILGRLRMGKGVKWLYPKNPEYERQLFAEQKRSAIDKKTGRESWVWVQVRKDNHAFDTGCMQLVVAMMHPMVDLPELQSLTG